MTSPLTAPSIVRALKELLSSDRVITDHGAGANLIEVLADLARAADRLAASIERFCDMNEEG